MISLICRNKFIRRRKRLEDEESEDENDQKVIENDLQQEKKYLKENPIKKNLKNSGGFEKNLNFPEKEMREQNFQKCEEIYERKMKKRNEEKYIQEQNVQLLREFQVADPIHTQCHENLKELREIQTQENIHVEVQRDEERL